MKIAWCTVALTLLLAVKHFESTPAPSYKPSKAPTAIPTVIPSTSPTARPSGPTRSPTFRPSSLSSAKPSNPTAIPTTKAPSAPPSRKPTGPSVQPTYFLSSNPTTPPSAITSDTFVTFECTNDVQIFTVPAGVHSITVTLVGAGGYLSQLSATRVAQGGRGGLITSTVPVNPGEVYHIHVGGAGVLFDGGYNGGGDARGMMPYCAAGGGGTDFRAYPYGIDDRMIVAGGGGGASGQWPCTGGDGGYPSGPIGGDCPGSPIATGGTQSSPGRLGDNTGLPYYGNGDSNGGFWYGGKSVWNPTSGYGYGGGGGGGYYGGGGGYIFGGGGGSSYSAYPILESINGTRYGNGTATIRYAQATNPTALPTSAPPTASPTLMPSASPSALPSVNPSAVPSAVPTAAPSANPTMYPTYVPSIIPTANPTVVPTAKPTAAPSNNPTADPTASPSVKPTPIPSSTPTVNPTLSPSTKPSAVPSTNPSVNPTAVPTASPTLAPTAPTVAPSLAGPSADPTFAPSEIPTEVPSASPTAIPTAPPSANPSVVPSAGPTVVPTAPPSEIPTEMPSATPTEIPTPPPSAIPTIVPSASPTVIPSIAPSPTPTEVPSEEPSADPSAVPTELPTTQPSEEPTAAPTFVPTASPTFVPTASPSAPPSASPTVLPTTSTPSAFPTAAPSESPTNAPSAVPSAVPTTALPSVYPTATPSASPTAEPTAPSAKPTETPTAKPSSIPTTSPTAAPTVRPSASPTLAPSPTPPTARPSAVPSTKPTVQPSFTPGVPTTSPVPTVDPSAMPTVSPSVVNTGERLLSIQLLSTLLFTLFICCYDGAASPTAIPAAPILAVTLTSKTRNSITIATTFTAATYSGTLYCAAFADGSAVTNSQVITSASTASAAYLMSATSATVTIAGLQAVVNYDTYCVASTAGGIVSLATSLSATKLDVQTSCCNMLAYTAAPSYVYGALSKYSGTTPPVFSYALSASPRSALTITPVVRNATSGDLVDTSVVTVHPASTAFAAGGGMVGQFFLSGSALLTGQFEVELVPSGASVADYDTGVVTYISIQSSASIAPAPALLNAKFSDSGASIVVTFDSATDRATISTQTFDCSVLFDFVGVSTATCAWASYSSVSVTFNPVAYGIKQVDVGGTFTLKGSLVKAACVAPADCTYYASATQQSVNVLAADHPVVPLVTLRVPSVISGCDDFTIDASLSSGSGSRAWTSVVWVATMTTSAGTISATSLQALLNSYGHDTSSPIGVSKSLISNARYTVSLSLTNFFGQVSSATASFSPSDNPNLPISSILGPSVVSIVPNDVLTLYTATQFASCASASSVITYSWSVTKDGVLQTIPSISSSLTKFVLSPYTLSLQTVYVVSFTANASASTSPAYPSIATTTSVTVQVGRGNIIAVVVGGSYRSLAGGSTDLTLDASQSYDQSYPIGSTVTGEALFYSWTCVGASAATYGVSCASALPTDHTSSKLVIASSGLTYGELYLFTVTATAADGRTSSYAVTVQNKAGSTTTAINNIALTKVNPAKKLILTGYVQGGYALDAQWSAWIGGVSQTFTANTPLLGSFSRAQVVNTLAYPLSVPSNTFAAGAVITFRIHASYAGNAALFPSYSDVTITMNAPPTGGVVSANPSVGDALSQVFSVTSAGWTDDATDYPLAYEFAYRLNSAQLALTVQSKTTSNVASTTLPAGLDSQGNAVTLIVAVYDNFLATATVSTSVVVTAPADLDVTDYVTAQLASVASSGDTSVLTQVISNAASLINAVKCSSVNSTYCGALNRSPCYSTPQKCSACLSGYTGLAGDGNTMCRNDGAVLSGTGMGCSTNNDCSMGLCVNSVCALPTLECPSTTADVCSGHGSCEYHNRNGRAFGTVCTLVDLDCTATCNCADGYGGAACSLPPVDLESFGTARSSLCSAVVSIASSDDVSFYLLDSLIGALYSAYDPNEILSATGREACYNALTLLSGFSADGYLSEESSTLIIDLASKFVQDSYFYANGRSTSGRRLLASDRTAATVDTAVSNIISGILRNMADGEEPVVYSNGQVEVTVYKALSSNFTKLSVPQTSDITTYMEVTESTAAALESTSGYIQASSLVWLANPYPNSTQLDASLFRVEVFGADATIARRTQETETEAAFYIVSQFTATQDFNFTLSIDQARAAQTNNFTFPECAQYVDGQYKTCHGCWVSTYTNSNVTYACPLSALFEVSDGTRKLQANSNSQQSQFSTVVSNIYSPSDDTVRYGFEMNWGREKILLAFLATLTFVIFVGFVYFAHQDSHSSIPVSSMDSKSVTAVVMQTAEGGKSTTESLVASFLDSVFAASDLQVYADATWAGFFHMLLKHHKYTAVFYGSTVRASHSLRWTSLTMGFLLNLFFDTVFFGVFYPDNGLCQDHHNIDSCLNPNSRVTDTNLCQWLVDETTGDGKCGLNPPPRTFVFLIVIVMVVVVISAPFQAAYDYLLVNVCMRRPRFEDWTGRVPSQQLSAMLSSAPPLLTGGEYQANEMYDGTLSAQTEADRVRQAHTESSIAAAVIQQIGTNLIAVVVEARGKSDKLEDRVNKVCTGNSQAKEVLLLQHFILEQFSTFKQFVLRRHMYDLAASTQTPVHPLLWILSWSWVVLSLAFFLAWAFAWAATHRGSAAADWGIVIGTALAQDLFVIQVFRVWVIYSLSMVSIRPQLLDIYRALRKVALSYSQDELGGSVVELRVCQHLSPACRASHSKKLYTLAGANILRRVDDADVAACREKRYTRLSVTASVVLAVPVAFSLLHDTCGVVALTALLPAFFDALLIMNRYFYAGAGLFILLPYGLAIVLFALYILLHPARGEPSGVQERTNFKKIAPSPKSAGSISVKIVPTNSDENI